MDAGNQTAAVSFLHQTAANLGGIETNAPDFTPSLLELLFGNNRPQVKAPFYCCEIGLRETRDARSACCLQRCAGSLCSLWCGCIRAGAELPPRPQVSSYVTTDGRSADHKSDVEQLERQQGDFAPSSKRSHLFKAAVETPLLDLRGRLITLPPPPQPRPPRELRAEFVSRYSWIYAPQMVDEH